MKRTMMAVLGILISIGMGGSAYAFVCAGNIFDDVNTTTVSLAFCDYIEQFSGKGITSGCSVAPPLYCPDDNVTRGQMAVFMVKLFENDVTMSGNLSLPSTTATTGIIMSGTNTLIHTYGANNFFAGEGAGNLTMTGYTNTAVGRETLKSTTSGFSNTASGYWALYSNTTGHSNTASGDGALQNNTSGYRNTANGVDALKLNTSGWHNTAIGDAALHSNSTGYGNTASGYSGLSQNTSGYYNTAIGYDSDVSTGNLHNATAIGYGAIVTASNRVVIGNTDVTSIGGYAAWSNFSDIRSKTDVQDVGYGIEFIRQLRPVSFRMKNGNGNTDFGFIAQDIEALLGSEYNVLDIGGGEDRMLSLRYTQFIAPIVKAMQEQQEIIETQNYQIKSQNAQIKTLEERLAKIEALLAGK